MKARMILLPLAFLGGRAATAQDLSGEWQGVELTPMSRTYGYWPAQLTLQAAAGPTLSGELYQEIGGQPEYQVVFRMRGTRTATGFTLQHRGTGIDVSPPNGAWCRGEIAFTYDAAEEKLTGRAAYQRVNDCSTGTFELYRVRLKSAATVPAGALSTLRVSGRNVRWFADPDLRKPLAAGNSYRTKLSKTTTFYVVQGFYVTDRSATVPITVKVGKAGGKAPTPARPPVAAVPAPAVPEAAPAPVPAPPAPAAPPAAPAPAPAPLVLPTVLFRLATAELLPTAAPALDSLAAQLRRRPALRLRITGHTDRLGEPDKNLALSEQRAAAVKEYLVRAGIEAQRLETIGYGDARPLFKVPDPRNRRVEVSPLPPSQ